MVFALSDEMDKENFMACLYIAHCYHDQSDTEHALLYYELVDQESLMNFQTWRYVKLIEQIGYCYYNLGNEHLARDYFNKVLNWYKILPAEDRVMPVEILQCLSDSDEIVIAIKELL